MPFFKKLFGDKMPKKVRKEIKKLEKEMALAEREGKLTKEDHLRQELVDCKIKNGVL